MSKFSHHEKCPKCGSSDGLAVYDDSKHCFSAGCSYHENSTGDKGLKDEPRTTSKDRVVSGLPEAAQGAIKDRGISGGSVQKFRVTVSTDPLSPVGHIYPYFDINGAHVANKVRRKGEKAFYWEGDPKASTLFGQMEFPAGGKAVTITEGELDALAAFELTGSRFPCVSVKSASEAKRNCAEQLEYLQSFDRVVICFDNDKPGQDAALEVAQLFKPGQACVLKLAKGKDANDYLMKKVPPAEFVNEWFRAPAYTPDGIKIGRDMWDEIANHQIPKSVPYPFAGLNYHTYGIRLSELVIITAETGVGKTSVLKEIEHDLLTNPELIEANAGVGFLHFEEPNYDTVIGLMSIAANKPYHLPDTERTTEELRKVYDELICNDRVVIWDHFGSNNVDAVLAKIRHMAALGCKYVVVDHLSIIVSDQSGDERRQLDEISTKLKTLCMNLKIAVIAVIHQNRQGQIRGTAGVEQLANIVMKLHREKTDLDNWRRNITKVIVEKNRFCGRTGPSCWLFYNEITGRLEELTKEQAEDYENGGNGAGQEVF